MSVLSSHSLTMSMDVMFLCTKESYAGMMMGMDQELHSALVSVGRKTNINSHHYYTHLLEKNKCLICSRLCIQLFIAENILNKTYTKNLRCFAFKTI